MNVSITMTEAIGALVTEKHATGYKYGAECRRTDSCDQPRTG
ncbi:hypothetical protein [Kibdelosporangium philippinense]